jgi:uncharacterized protein YndB with AHSA1/START domain
MQNHASIEINRPPEVIFPYIDDHAKLKLWMKDFMSSNRPPDADSRVGMTFQMTFGQQAGSRTADTEIIAYEPNKRLKLRSTDISFTVDIDFTLTSANGATRVNYDVESTPLSPFFKLMMGISGMFMKGIANKQLQRDLKKLKQIAESEN